MDLITYRHPNPYIDLASLLAKGVPGKKDIHKIDALKVKCSYGDPHYFYLT